MASKPSMPAIVAGNIKGRMRAYNVGMDLLAAAMQMPIRTAQYRLLHPETMRLYELVGAARVLNTTPRALVTMDEEVG